MSRICHYYNLRVLVKNVGPKNSGRVKVLTNIMSDVIMSSCYRVIVSSCHHFIIYVIMASCQVVNFWQVFAAFDNFYQQLETSGNIWLLFATFANFQQYLTTFVDSWQHYATLVMLSSLHLVIWSLCNFVSLAACQYVSL